MLYIYVNNYSNFVSYLSLDHFSSIKDIFLGGYLPNIKMNHPISSYNWFKSNLQSHALILNPKLISDALTSINHKVICVI